MGAVISIDTNRNRIKYSDMIFGQFIEHFHKQIYGGIFDPESKLSDKDGFRKDVIEALLELQVPVVRWPGGCFVSSYNWLEGVGSDRKPSFDKAWRVEDSNQFGTDEFIQWCRKINAEPYICTNAGTGTPEEMSDWVEYCNLKDEGRYANLRQSNGYRNPHNVKYWSIGNENYGWWEVGAKTVDEWGNFVLESAKMMRNVDPSIQLFAAANYDLDWTLKLVRIAGRQLDYISIHGYYDRLQQKNEPSDYLTCMTKTIIPERQIKRAEQIIAVAGFEDKIHIAFDEWNLRSWHHPGHGRNDRPINEMIAARDKNSLDGTYTMADAVFSACFLNACLRHAKTVKMANMAPVVNTRGPIHVHPDGIVKRTTFHVLKMYSDLLYPYVVDAYIESDSLIHKDVAFPVIDAIVTCDKDREHISMMLINKHPKQIASCVIIVDGRPMEGSYDTILLCGDSPDAYNDIDHPNRVEPFKQTMIFKEGKVELPPHSILNVTLVNRLNE
jgi:alpha-N-arabinofuranosidase